MARRFRTGAVAVVLVAVALVAVRPLAVETLRIESGSMAPTLRAGDRVLVDKLTFDVEEVQRGDVVAFEDPERPGQVAIKRVVALPDDTVAIRAGALMVNGRRQREAYLEGRPTGSDFYGPTVVPGGHVFVLGDNRPRSVDSRFSGPIPVEHLLGRVVARVWPPDRMRAMCWTGQDASEAVITPIRAMPPSMSPTPTSRPSPVTGNVSP